MNKPHELEHATSGNIPAWHQPYSTVRLLAAQQRDADRYRIAIRWIADNDEPDCTNVREVAWQISVALIADTFGKDADTVARAVIRRRKSRAANHTTGA